MDSRGQFNQLEVRPRNENQESNNVESHVEYNMSEILNENQGSNNVESNVEYNMSTGRILTGILIFIFFGILVLLIKYAKSYSYDFHIERLIVTNIVFFILQIVIPLIIIVRSENICVFFKNQMLKIFKFYTRFKKGESLH